MTDDVPPSVIAAWEALQSSWDQRVKHEAFMAAVSQTQTFTWAAKKYKERAGDPIAIDQLAKLQKAAVIVLTASATKRPEASSPYRTLVMLLIVAVLAIVVAVLMLDTLPKSRPQPTQPGKMR